MGNGTFTFSLNVGDQYRSTVQTGDFSRLDAEAGAKRSNWK